MTETSLAFVCVVGILGIVAVVAIVFGHRFRGKAGRTGVHRWKWGSRLARKTGGV